MTGARRALACIGLMLTVLTGCGSSASTSVTVTCTRHRLPSGAIRARVAVTNTTGSPITAFIYGPALVRLRHIYPVLNPAEVVLTVGSAKRPYIGYAVANIEPNKSYHVIMRFAPAKQRKAVLVSSTRSVQASDWSILSSPGCTI